jgi:hypothetical protein
MPEIISCPGCRRKLQAPEDVLGQEVQCPTCGATFTAAVGDGPFREASPPPAAPAPGPTTRPQRYADDYGLDADRGGRPDRPRRDVLPHRGAAVLTLGILALAGLVICLPALVLGPIAWAMGSNDLSLIRAGRMDRSGEGLTSGGQTCGLIATILGAIGLVLTCINFLQPDHNWVFGRRW